MNNSGINLSLVCSKLENYATIEPNGLINGKLGMAYIYAMYGFYTNSGIYLNKCHQLLKEIINDRHQMNSSLLRGKWGILWVLETLLFNGILEDSYEISAVIREIANDYLSYMFDSPVHINEDDMIFSQGFCALKQLRDDNSLSCYYLKEKLISYIDECEFLLTEKLPPIYCPTNLSELYLMSIYYFLSHVKYLYPTKCKVLFELVGSKLTNIKDLHMKILNNGIGSTSNSYPLSTLGFYNEIFMSPFTVKKTLEDRKYLINSEISRCDSLQELIGLGFAIISTYHE